MIDANNTVQFFQANCINIPICSLIIFWYNSVQHSMITTEANQWTGANNLSSLGIADALLLGGSAAGIGVYQYNNMSTRQHNHTIPRGGWSGTNMFAGATMTANPQQAYKMYYIPVLN